MIVDKMRDAIKSVQSANRTGGWMFEPFDKAPESEGLFAQSKASSSDIRAIREAYSALYGIKFPKHIDNLATTTTYWGDDKHPRLIIVSQGGKVEAVWVREIFDLENNDRFLPKGIRQKVAHVMGMRMTPRFHQLFDTVFDNL